MPATAFPHHDESSAVLSAPPERVFATLDNHRLLSSHMNTSSWQMGGGRMTTTLDAGGGQRVGSHIRMSGRAFGLEVSLDEVVTEREPPTRKVWETVDSPRLLVVGAYRMGFEVTSHGNGSRLRVFIDYALPPEWPARWLGRAFGRYYARWCTQTMVADAVRTIGRDVGTKHISIAVPGVACAGHSLEQAVARVTGVQAVSVNGATEVAEIEYDGGRLSVDTLIKAIERCGFHHCRALPS